MHCIKVYEGWAPKDRKFSLFARSICYNESAILSRRLP
jgi:hypothetical protein